jgi:hypothetical protein
MKTALFYSLALIVSFPLFAKEELIKACSTTIFTSEETPKSEAQFNIIKKDGALSVKISHKVDGQIVTTDDEVTIEDFKVKAGLTAWEDFDSKDKLNQGEKSISHALSLTTDPAFKNAFSTGFDLTKVRSVKIYTIGKPAKFGSALIVEAKDKSGKDLGSFLGGFLVSPCKDPKDIKVIVESTLKAQLKIAQRLILQFLEKI